jgi:hypothetical protein
MHEKNPTICLMNRVIGEILFYLGKFYFICRNLPKLYWHSSVSFGNISQAFLKNPKIA